MMMHVPHDTFKLIAGLVLDTFNLTLPHTPSARPLRSPPLTPSRFLFYQRDAADCVLISGAISHLSLTLD